MVTKAEQMKIKRLEIGDENLKELSKLTRLTENGILIKLLSMSVEELLAAKEKQGVIFKLKDGRYYNKFMVAEITGTTPSNVTQRLIDGGLEKINQMVFDPKVEWYNKLGFKNRNDALNTYKEVPFGYLLQKTKELDFNKCELDKWYNDYLEHKKILRRANKIKEVTGQNIDFIITLLNKGYRPKQIIKAKLAGTSVSRVDDVIQYKGTYKLLSKIIKDNRFSKVEVNNDVCKFGIKEVERRLNDDFYDNIPEKNALFNVDGVDYSYDEIIEMLEFSRRTVITYVARKPIELANKIRFALKGEYIHISKKYLIEMPNGIKVSRGELCELYGISKMVLTNRLEKANGDSLTLFYLLEQDRFNICLIYSLLNNDMELKEWAKFVNTDYSNVKYYYDNKLDNKFISNYHVRERLLFKDNSPHSTWFADDTWIYECPICKRKLLMHTKELINYKHDDVLCEEYKI